MADHITKGEEFEKKAEKKLSGWGLFGSKYEDAAELYEKAANSFKLAKSWDKAGSINIKLANCHLKLDSKHEAANAYADAANCYKKTSNKVIAIVRALRSHVRHSSLVQAMVAPTSDAILHLSSTIHLGLEAIACLEQAAAIFLEIGRLNMAARYYKEIGELYEVDQNLQQAIEKFDQAAELFQSEEVTTSANQCRQKVAQFSAQLEQ
ncbi:Alpha-soluble NSF attachment protein [Vitis vinifera]|uniref:Alpha-soluble NSF attachment protein n=1 Tax=Vitis vinifera TaxID=29760 RepID=A0A438FV41_VITVI|nr:Alpha-soluble NSF attachment protein [Vitis vinifera]